MFFSGFRKYEHIIYVNKTRDFQHFPQNKLNQALETCRGVGQTKGHHKVFVESPRCPEICLPFVAFLLRFQPKKWRIGEGGCSEGMIAGPRSSQGWL
jgi:hypothetical protein